MLRKRREIEITYDNTVENVHSLLEELKSLQAGEYTLNTFWKSKAQKQLIINNYLGQKDEWLASVSNTRLHFQCVT